jgi:hypothetical protein
VTCEFESIAAAEAIAADYRTSPARGDATALDDDAATEEACARYEAGFADCVAEVQRFMTSVQQGHHGDVIEHLSTCLRTTGRRRSAVYRLTAIESGSVSGRLSETDQTMATWGHGDWPTTLLAADEMRATSCGEDTNHSNASRSTKPPMSDAGRTDAPAVSVLNHFTCIEYMLPSYIGGLFILASIVSVGYIRCR